MRWKCLILTFLVGLPLTSFPIYLLLLKSAADLPSLAAEQRDNLPSARLAESSLESVSPSSADGDSLNTPLTKLDRNPSKKPRSTGKHWTGGPVWPTGEASFYEWEKAVGRLYKVPRRKKGLDEIIFAMDPSKRKNAACGSPCVAHCIAGQPRDMTEVKGLWKGMKHRLFDVMSKSPVVFAVFSISWMMNSGKSEGGSAYVRMSISGVAPEMLRRPLKYMEVDRALLLDETACQTGSCLAKSAGLVCDAKELGLTALYDKKKGTASNFCDVQFRRIQTCMHLVREYEGDKGMTFDWVTRQRPDVYWTAPAGSITTLSPKVVHFHSWGACGYGGADWFIVAPRRHAEIIGQYPDGMACRHYLHPRILPNPCHSCLGCECSLMAWLLNNSVEFKALPFDGMVPAKFCGDKCPADWKFTEKE